MNHLKSMTQAELGQVLKELGQPAFRAKQVFVWLHKGVKSFDEMTNLSKALREKLKEHFFITAPQAARKQISAWISTQSVLLLQNIHASSILSPTILKNPL